jgi:hypothetical protein
LEILLNSCCNCINAIAVLTRNSTAIPSLPHNSIETVLNRQLITPLISSIDAMYILPIMWNGYIGKNSNLTPNHFVPMVLTSFFNQEIHHPPDFTADNYKMKPGQLVCLLDRCIFYLQVMFSVDISMS